MIRAVIGTPWSRSLVALAALCGAIACGGPSGRASSSSLEDSCVAAAGRSTKCGDQLPSDVLIRSCRAEVTCRAKELRAEAEAPYMACITQGPCGADCVQVAGRQLADSPALADLKKRCLTLSTCSQSSGACRYLSEEPAARVDADATWTPFLACFGAKGDAKACEKTIACVDAAMVERGKRSMTCVTQALR
jgi:hypothetical protein